MCLSACVALGGASGCAMNPGHEDAQRPHSYEFSRPELLSAQRVFGIGYATTLLGQACDTFPDATASYTQWAAQNRATMQQLTDELADYYRLVAAPSALQRRVAAAMHLKTELDLSQTALDEACPTLPATLALPRLNLQQRLQETLTEVSDPNYLKLRPKTAPTPPVPETKDTP